MMERWRGVDGFDTIGSEVWRCIVLVAALALPLWAVAEDSIGKQTGTELLARCEPALRMVEAGSRLLLNDAEYAQAQSCIGFVDGFIWGHGWAAWRQHGDMYYCPPEQFTARQFVPALVEYLRAHPDRLDAPAHVLMFSALTNAYPCQPAASK
jgi:Rap1a immunity proteins